MQTIRDAAVLLGIIVLLTSVRFAPVEALGEVLPVGQVQAAEAQVDSTPALAVPAIRVLSDRAHEQQAQASKQSSRTGVGCSSSVIRVKTLDVDGQRVILRIDSEAGTAEAVRATQTTPKPCKIG